jgi:glycosyltransferase involved in cell wall biosynthesis
MRGLWHITRWSKELTYVDTDHFALAQKMEIETALAADHVLAITGVLKEWLVEHGIPEAKISIAPNAVNLDQFTILERDNEYAHALGCAGKFIIGYIGSFTQYEGLDLLLQAVAMLPYEIRKKIILLWVGHGPAMEGLLQLAAELGVSDHILALGRKPFGEIPKLYSLVDICVFPRKGQVVCEIISPLKPFEAMAMKKAVIVSDVRPLREIVDHEITGLIHIKDDVVSLSQQLCRLIEDEELRTKCGEAARKWVEQTRSWRTIAESITGLYTKMVV